MVLNVEVSYSWLAADVLCRSFKGDLTIDALFESFENVLNMKVVDTLPKGIITDLRQANLKMERADMVRFREFHEKHKAYYDQLIIAILVSSPESTALAQIAKKKVGAALNNEIFSTKEAALAWIQSQLLSKN